MRRRGDVMWRNFGWTAILATWTIFLILNSGLAGEQILKKPQNNNEDNVHHETTHPVFDKKVVDYSRLRYARENFKSNDRSSMHAKAVSLEFKNTENRDSRLNGHEKHIAMSNAIATTKYLKDSDDKSERLITKRTGNVWLSKVIVMEKSKNTRNYLKFMSSLRPPPPTSQELKSASRKKRRKERTIYVFLNDHKKMGTIRHDIQAHDKKGGRWKKYERDRIFSGENGMTAFFPDKFTKNSRSEKDSSTQKLKNSDISQLKTTKAEIIVSRYANGAHKHNRNERDFRQSLELTKNSTNKLIYVRVNDKSRRVEPTFSNYSSSEVNRSCGNETITTTTDNAIIENSPYQRSVAVTWTTLIFNSKISSVNGEVGDEENTVSPSSEYSKSKSYKVNEFLASAETYKRNEYSKVGFKVSTDTHGNKKENGNSVDSFTSRASNSLNNHFAKKRASFTKRPFLHRKKNELKASDIFDQRRQYYFPTSDINTNRKTRKLGEMRIRKKTEEKEITAAANYATHDTLGIEPDPSPTNLSTKGIDKSNLDYQMPVRISVTQKRNPIHVRHVGSDADCERRRRTEFEAGVRDAFRIGLRNVSNPSTTAKFNSFLDQKPNGRPKYSQKFHAINVGTLPRIAETTDGKLEHDRDEPRGTSTESVSIFFGGANIGDNSIGMRKINGHVQSSSELTDEPGLENVRVTTRRGGNHRDMNEGSGFYSRSDGVHNSKYRRYKRHEDRNTPRISTSTEFDSGTWKTLDTATTTSNLLIEFTANPPISTTETNNVDQISTSAKEVLTSVEAPPSSKYREFQKEWQSTPLTTNHDERYTNAPARMGFNASDSSEISLIDAPKTFNVSSVETPYLIEAHDRSRATTKIDNSIIPKEVPPAVEANVRISDATNKNAFEVSSTELINSQGEQGAYGNESVWTIDPLPQKNNDPSRGIFESITMENIIDSSASDVLSDQWPVKHSAVVEGDLVLGGLMMVHEREDRITCGRVMPQGGIQALEAMLYTLDTLNDREIVPGVKIGAHILDDCDKDTYGLEMAVDFIKGTYAYVCNVGA
ncbi:Metabotropic glutamate receptor 2 [Temnothorax longispinosus]|uniref:Metabotropic glutamate receptor 2 n=1 Tax=Temnothorax longispinosus TaxID=300112 RepID=A0A4S2KZY3_9HYME|nr:Metabotropic glutamate receptor 2 [Temnothorax longispinosus]